MTKRRAKDVAASVRARLQTKAKDTNRPFQEVLQYFAMERFLYRLSQSPHAEKLVRKGGLMLTAWRAPESRPTRDIDFLATMSNNVDTVAEVVREICDEEVNPDGLKYDVASLEGRIIKEDADYAGVRVNFRATLQNARIPMQIDSRIRDFFAIWLLARQFDFDGRNLTDALRRTFENRGTAINTEPVALTPVSASDAAKQTQWSGFCRKSRIAFAPETLQEVCDAIALFIKPVAAAVEAKQPFGDRWTAPGPWRAG